MHNIQVIEPGHTYKIENTGDDSTQTLSFLRKTQSASSEGNAELQTVQAGTTNEEVLWILIDRLNFLNKQMPCRENSIAITKMEEALMWLNKRTVSRINRGVEGTHKA